MEQKLYPGMCFVMGREHSIDDQTTYIEDY